MTDTATPPEAAAAAPLAPERRDRYMPVRKRALLDAALEDPALSEADSEGLAALGRRLALLFHLAFFGPRERLKDLYVRFNPDQPGTAPVAAAPEERATFLTALDETLEAANFAHLSQDDLLPEPDSKGRVRAKVAVPQDVFEEVRFYGRGRRQRSFELRSWFGLRTEILTAMAWDHVVLVASLRPEIPKRQMRNSRLRPGAIYLKLFRDIPQADLETLYPDARVVMRLQDKLVLGVPAIAGGIPILLNILPALSVLLVVIGAYLGISGTVEEDQTKQALAALSGLGALVGFIGRQWIKYERQKFKYQKQVAENAYFNNLNNNAAFFDYLIGASEDSEVKEAFLAYFMLVKAEAPLGRAELDGRIEDWLKARFAVDVDFEIDDALAKLDRFGLVAATPDGKLTAPPLAEALAAADGAWRQMAEAAFAETPA
ncbi:MAG: TMEM143 family protein [Pikeienuella sp.]